MLIREMTTARDAPIAIGAEFRRTVHVFDVAHGKRLITLDTAFGAGGGRLCLSNDGRICIVGSWDRGVEAFEVDGGRLLWRSPTLVKAGKFRVSRDGLYLTLVRYGVDETEYVDISTGRSLGSVPEVKVRESHLSDLSIVERWSGDGRVEVRKSGSAVRELVLPQLRAVGFGPRSVVLAPFHWQVAFCIDEDGTEQWRVSVPKGSLLRDFFFSERTGFWYGIKGHENQSSRELMRLGPDLVEPIASLGEPCAECYVAVLDSVVTSDGRVFDVASGQAVRSSILA